MYEYSYGTLTENSINKTLDDEIMDIIKDKNDYPKGSDEQKIKDLYLMYLDTEARNSAEILPLKSGIECIDSAVSIEDFIKACGEIYIAYGCEILPMPYFSQNHYDGSKYSPVIGQMDLFYSPDELINGKDTAEDLQKSIAVILEILKYENADKYAYDIVSLLAEIAESTSDMTNASVEKLYNIYSNDDFSALFGMYYSFGNFGNSIRGLPRHLLWTY